MCRLTECGHVICLGCLLQWFENLHVKFLLEHPGYVNLTAENKQSLGQPLVFPRECGRACEHLEHSAPHPHYTCPTCQTRVTRTPLKDFKIAAVVRWYGFIRGEVPPVTEQEGAVFERYLLL